MLYSQDDILEVAARYPGSFSCNGRCFEILFLSLAEFQKLSENKWHLKNYEISITLGNDESLVAVSFIPLPAYEINDVPVFEIPVRGMYKNGRGVTYVYAVESGELLKTIYMR